MLCASFIRISEQVLLVKLVNAGIDLGRCLFRSSLLSSGLIFWRLISICITHVTVFVGARWDHAAANIPTASVILVSVSRANRPAHRGRNQTAIIEMAALRRLVGSLLVVECLVALRMADSLRVMFFNILSHHADLSAIIALIIVAVYWLSIESLANLLGIIFHAAVRKEPATRARGGCGATRQRARTHCKVPKELRLLIGKALLLRKLVVHSRFTGLISLLLHLTHLHLGLSRLHLSLLVGQPEIGNALPTLKAIVKHIIASTLLESCYLSGLPKHAVSGSLLELRLLSRHPINVLAHPSRSLSRTQTLSVLLLAQTGYGLSLTNVLTVQSLPKRRLLLGSR